MQINLEIINPYENSTYLFREYIQPYFTSPRHFHHQFELIYIDESYGKLYAGNSIVDFKKGDLFLIAPKLIHCFKNPKGYEQHNKYAKATCVFFMPDFLGDDFLRRAQTKLLTALFQKSEFGLQFPEPEVELIELLKSLNSSDNLKGIINLLMILDKLSLHKNPSILSDTMLNKYYYRLAKDDRIEKVIDYVFKNSSKKITIKEMANLVHMSEAGFSRFFKARTEINFTGFINEIRISKSQKILIETSKSISDIGRECGYENLSYFNRQFKLLNKLSPKTFREYFINSSSALL